MNIPEDAKMNYRGKATAKDDTDNFTMSMAMRGYLVVVAPKRPKEEVTPNKRAGRPQAPSWCYLRDLQ
jgi:hypothetical protein